MKTLSFRLRKLLNNKKALSYENSSGIPVDDSLSESCHPGLYPLSYQKILLSSILFLFFLLFFLNAVSAQMTNRQNLSIAKEEVAKHQEEEQSGKDIFENLQKEETSCQKLTEDDYKRMGDYFMFRMIGDTRNHVIMDKMMGQMMGEEGEEQMHVVLGKRGSGCDKNAAIPENMPWMFGWMFKNIQGGGVNNMMGPFGTGGMMGYGFGTFSVIGTIFWIVILIDLILLGIWLWKQINKK